MKNSIVLDWAWCQGNREYHPPSCYCADLCIIPWETQRKCKNKKTKKNPIHALHICKAFEVLSLPFDELTLFQGHPWNSNLEMNHIARSH